MREIKIDRRVPLPESHWKAGPIPFEADISKMRVGDSVGFKLHGEMARFISACRKYSRHKQKGKWLFRQTEVGQFRVWRCE